MQSFLLIVHVLVAVAVIGLILLQQGRGADAGAAFGSGASGSVFGSRGPTTFLTRMTTVLISVFFLTSLSLAWLSGQSVDRRSVVEKVQSVPAGAPASEPLSAPPANEDDAPALPQAPSSSQTGD